MAKHADDEPSLAVPRCYERRCKHFGGVRGTEEEGQVPICSAFQDGIPDEIAYGDNQHTEAFEGDQGIQFEEGERYNEGQSTKGTQE